jgi:hypothetical protein
MKIKDMRRKIANLPDDAEIRLAFILERPEPPKASVIFATDPITSESVALWVFDKAESPDKVRGQTLTGENIDELLRAIGCK